MPITLKFLSLNNSIIRTLGTSNFHNMRWKMQTGEIAGYIEMKSKDFIHVLWCPSKGGHVLITLIEFY